VEAEELIVVIISSLGILSGVAVIWMAMQSRRQIREMEHRERLAMIERGLVPPPELDPGAFERKFAATRTPESPGATRARSGGVIMISLGLALMFMLSFAAGAPGVGIGIGGAFALLGAGFFVNSLLMSRSGIHRPPIANPIEPGRYGPGDPPSVT
jgi:predicted phage tail protein